MPSKAKDGVGRRSLLARFGRRSRDRARLLPLYRAVVAAGRDPSWYRECRVPDSVSGRFDMIAAVIAIVLVRFEAESDEEAKRDAVLLTETFIEDMDQSLRQIGIGDYVVGKHVGRMMGALGGRLAAFREAASGRDYAAPVRRNIYRESPPDEAAVARVAERLERFDAVLRVMPIARIVEGELPPP